jgi:hypothetical protein
MADLKLDIIVVPTYNVNTLAIVDASTYPDSPPIVSGATIVIDVPNFGVVTLPFIVGGETNIYSSSTLGISPLGVTEPLPDGIYKFRYSIFPNGDNFVNKTIMRVDKIQEKFDEAFMKLDMMQCDRAIATQSKVTLNTIYFFIQGSVASANNCANVTSEKLYTKADIMLNNFIKNNCGCNGNNYQINFY